MEFNSSQTKVNLLKAFAGESQARNRYTFSASAAKKDNKHVIEAVFKFTADQEKEHAEIFYNHLKECAGEKITIEQADYPIDLYDDVLSLLRAAQHNEYGEFEVDYQRFGEMAKEEGFNQIATDFFHIAKIEKIHGDRFGMYADMIENNTLFISKVATKWMCLNCGHVLENTKAPDKCPVCDHDQGYFIRLELAPYTNNGAI